MYKAVLCAMKSKDVGTQKEMVTGGGSGNRRACVLVTGKRSKTEVLAYWTQKKGATTLLYTEEVIGPAVSYDWSREEEAEANV